MPALIAEGGYQEFTLKGGEWAVLLLSAAAALLAIAVGFFLAKLVLAEDEGSPKMQEIAKAIQEGASAYLKRQFKTIAVILVPLAAIVFLTSTEIVKPDEHRRPVDAASPALFRTLAFILGCLASGLTGYIGMTLATRGNVRTAAAALTNSLPKALTVAFRTGGVAGMFTVGLGLLGATAIIMIFQNTSLGHPHRLRLRRLAARAVPARRRRHLHQGRRRRRRPGRQGRGRHPRGRPAQPGHHRRQRGRQRRRLRRHGRRPVRELRGHPRRLDHPRRGGVQLDRRQPGARPDLPARRSRHRRDRLHRRRVRREGQGGRDQRPEADQQGLPRRRLAHAGRHARRGARLRRQRQQRQRRLEVLRRRGHRPRAGPGHQPPHRVLHRHPLRPGEGDRRERRDRPGHRRARPVPPAAWRARSTPSSPSPSPSAWRWPWAAATCSSRSTSSPSAAWACSPPPASSCRKTRSARSATTPPASPR